MPATKGGDPCLPIWILLRGFPLKTTCCFVIKGYCNNLCSLLHGTPAVLRKSAVAACQANCQLCPEPLHLSRDYQLTLQDVIRIIKLAFSLMTPVQYFICLLIYTGLSAYILYTTEEPSTFTFSRLHIIGVKFTKNVKYTFSILLVQNWVLRWPWNLSLWIVTSDFRVLLATVARWRVLVLSKFFRGSSDFILKLTFLTKLIWNLSWLALFLWYFWHIGVKYILEILYNV